LLKDAEVHRLDGDDGQHQYVLVDYGMDLETVRKVPQLHLGRLFRDGKTIYGAKVVNKTLGDCAKVCGKLLEAALDDAWKQSSGGDDIQALATLHGLSDYVLEKQNGDTSPTIIEIAQNQADSTSDGQAWETICLHFVQAGLSSEANLYQNHNGKFSHIGHNRDTTDYANTCAGSMAVFRFPK
jgi:hypothetical protein